MGACVSTHPKKPGNSRIAKRFISSPSKKKKNDNPANFPVSNVKFKLKPSLTWREISSSSGSKEETSFDASMWINSSFDDDFFSVKDFTPSRTSSPSHGNSFIVQSSLDSSIRIGSKCNSSSSRREQIDDQDNGPEIRKNSRSYSFRDVEEVTDHCDAAGEEVTLAMLLQDGFWTEEAGLCQEISTNQRAESRDI